MKLFVTDYDDTLYNGDLIINKNINKLKELQQNNFKVVISTGRSYPSILNQVNKYNIPYDYISCCDGSIIYDDKGRIIDAFYLSKEIIKPFINFYQNLNYEEIQFSYKEGYSNILKDDNLLGINIVLATDNYKEEIIKDFLKLKNMYPEFNFLPYRHPNFSYLCVKPKNVSKSFAIKRLKERLNINDNDIYVIGDADNDFEMIRDYHGVGMKTSCDSVKEIANKLYNEVYDYINDILK